MAELLLMVPTVTNTDPEKDVRGCYKRGDLVVIRESGFAWGRDELLPPAQGGVFVRIEISDVTVAQAQNFAFNKLGFQFSRTFTAAANTDRLTIPDAVAVDGMLVRVRAGTGGTLPNPLVSTQDYYVRDSGGTVFRLAATPGGNSINLTSAGSGTREVGIPYRIEDSRVDRTDLNRPVRLLRRLVRADLDGLPAGVRDQLDTTGFYSTTWATARNYLREKIADTVF